MINCLKKYFFGIIGLLLILFSFFFGLYMGVYWGLIGGLVDIINAIKAMETTPWPIFIGVIKVFLCPFIGFGSFIAPLFFGIVCIKLHDNY